MDVPHALTGFASERFSPVRYDAAHVATAHDVDALLEAARWAPSAGNSQPWSFVVGIRGDDVHRRLVRHLARSSSAWAADARVLVANLALVLVAGADLEYSEFARYDLGQAVAHLTFQAHSLGLAVHQFRAFDRDGVAGEFGVPPHWEVTSMAAIGVPLGGPEAHVGAGTSRERRSRTDITWSRA
ncbi:MAG TPA: nitroreductase family protein [Nocardioides sp.]|nr:nitroreductase family protein [Nocardioides sp.]